MMQRKINRYLEIMNHFTSMKIAWDNMVSVFAEKNVTYQKNANSENGSCRVGRLHREKCQKNENPEKMRVRMSLFG